MSDTEPRYLSMPDPPGATRMEVIAAKLSGNPAELERVFDRIDHAKQLIEIRRLLLDTSVSKPDRIEQAVAILNETLDK